MRRSVQFLVVSAGLALGAASPLAQAAPPKPAKGGATATKPANSKKPPKGSRPATRKAGEPGQPDEGLRRVIAGTPHVIHESPELRAMRELDRALFPATTPGSNVLWVAEGTPLIERDEPRVTTTGLPPTSPLVAPRLTGAGAGTTGVEPTHDIAWLRKLTMPDIPVRWDARVVKYLETYRNNPQARSMVAGWIKKSGRYGGAIRRILRENNVPEDIVWLALVESGFDPTIQSHAGAAGMWQFMPDGARVYGLAVDRWIDERLDPERSTLAAARYLSDLHTRFGSWELAFAAYNMGYGGLLASIRKYNTNDFWELSRLEAGMPLETALYVPKIVALAIVAKNRAAFGIGDVELDPAVGFDKVSVQTGVTIQSVALAAGALIDHIAELNPQLTANRTPPAPMSGPASGAKEPTTFVVRVPPGTGHKAAEALPAYAAAESHVERHVMRWGETVDDLVATHHTTHGMMVALNGLRREESIRPGTVLLVPADGSRPPGAKPSVATDASLRALREGRPIVVVPALSFSYADRKRVFYRVVRGDGLRDVASLFGVTPEEVCRWNSIDSGASLHEGMALQIFTPRTGSSRPDVLLLEEKDAHVLQVGTPEFFAHFEGLRGRSRLEIVAGPNDTWQRIGQKYHLNMGQLERINGRARSSPLRPGDRVVVYVASPSKGGPHDRTPEPAEDRASEVGTIAMPHEIAVDDTGESAAREAGEPRVPAR